MSAPPITPAGPWARRLALLCVFHLAAWTLIPLLFHPNVSLDVAETVSWGHQWPWGTPKHPPLIAWIQEAARVISGPNPAGAGWAIYLSGQLVIVAAFWGVWRLARRLVPPEEAFLAVLALAGTYACTVVTLEFNHAMLLLPFVALAGWSAWEALTDGRWRWWLLLGGTLGLGMLSKYEMAFPAVCLAGFMLFDPPSRRWLKRPHPYVALALSLLLFAPHFAWLRDHHFVTLAYARGRMTDTPGLGGHLLSPLKFLRDQLLFILPVLVLLMPWLGWPRWRAAAPDQRWNRRFILTLTLGPLGLLLLLALLTGNELRGSWGIPLLLFVPLSLLACFQRRNAPPAARQTLALGITLIGINVAIAVLQPPLAPRLTHKPLRVQFPGQALAARVQEIWRQRVPGRALPMIAGERWMADNVAYYAADRPAVLCDQGGGNLDVVHLDEANCPWTSIAALNRDGGMLVWNATREGRELPAALREACPGALKIQVLELRWQTSADVPAVAAGVAIVPPAR